MTSMKNFDYSEMKIVVINLSHTMIRKHLIKTLVLKLQQIIRIDGSDSVHGGYDAGQRKLEG